MSSGGGFFRNLIDNVASVATSGSSAFAIKEISVSSLNSANKIDHDGYLFLTRDRLTCQAVLYNQDQCKHPFRHLGEQEPEQRLTPLHLCVATGLAGSVKELLQLVKLDGISIDTADRNGNTVIHQASVVKDSTILAMLLEEQASVVNLLNMKGETALHLACREGLPDNVELLLGEGNADMATSGTNGYPIHFAVEAGQIECISLLCMKNSAVVNQPDPKDQGAPLHWANTKATVDVLMSLGADINRVNGYGESVLLCMIRNKWLDSVTELLLNEADPNITGGKDDVSPLHLAISLDDVDLVRALIVFGADVNKVDGYRYSCRHRAALNKGSNRDIIIYTLHKVGALRCSRTAAADSKKLGVGGPNPFGGENACKDGCKHDGVLDGKPQGSPTLPRHTMADALYDDMINAPAHNAALGGTGKPKDERRIQGTKLLSLDGGGIRGLILVQILLRLEREAQRPIRDLFDWVIGTSTGGLLALGIVYGGKSEKDPAKTVRLMQRVYFKMKDDIFKGKRPYDEKPFEVLLKDEFGENTRMTSVTHPKIMVTTTLVDRVPPELHLFRNYTPPSIDPALVADASARGVAQPAVQFKKPPPPEEQLIWRAGRSTGAAPTYFRAVNRFLDGGMISNNPTLDGMTEIHEYNISLAAKGMEDDQERLGLVLSLGTGMNPIEEIKSVDVFRPEGIADVFNSISGAQSLGRLILEQATASDGIVVNRARAWCSMIHVPFFRFSPQLSQAVVLDTNDNSILLKMLWETEVYLYENRDKIKKLASLLVGSAPPPARPSAPPIGT